MESNIAIAVAGLQENPKKLDKNDNVSKSFDQKLIKKILTFSQQLQYYTKKVYTIFWYELVRDPPSIKVKREISDQDAYIIRRRRLYFLAIHLLSLVAVYNIILGRVKLYTILFWICLCCMASIGATAGAHRLWSHHAYKATWQLKLILIVFQTLSVQYSCLNWCLDHRLHHKFTDTDADPHNSSRGFFFCHIGWSILLSHPEVTEKLKTISIEDVKKDKFVMFQYKYYVPMVFIIAYVIPTMVPWYYWGESLWLSHIVCSELRHVLTLHSTFLINSAAHMWGTRPYDKNINPTENLIVSAATFGDGWHNYHHVFPWDYKNAELLDYKLNFSTAFIDLFSLIGWAYDLKTVPASMAAKRAARTGDGSHPSLNGKQNIWGWDDEDMPAEDRKSAVIVK